MSVDDYVSVIQMLRTVDLPAPETPSDWLAGPGFLVEVLRESGDFDDDLDALGPTWDEYAADLQSLLTAVTSLWGSGETVDLYGAVAEVGHPDRLPPLPAAIASCCPSVDLWRFPDRVICVWMAQCDKELPITLLAAAGDHWLE